VTQLDASLSITDLADARRTLNEDVRRHRDSVNFFASDAGFFRTALQVNNGAAVPPVAPLAPDAVLSGVTTTATCFESLQSALLDPETSDPRGFSGLAKLDLERLTAFANNATGRTEDWRSEGAARRYCIVRASAPLLRMVEVEDTGPIENALNWVWSHVSPVPGREAIFEVAPLANAGQAGGDQWLIDDDPKRRYPPNAFLTYWGLMATRELPAVAEAHADAVNQSKLWLRQVVGRESAYVYGGETASDPQQLAWAITGVVSSEAEPLADRANETTALIRAGLRAFFDQQRRDGIWDTGRALFHYPEAGNAYCYLYETLAELIGLAVEPQLQYHDEMRQLLRPYLGHLLRARASLDASRRRLGDDQGIGWSSGHHPHRTSPESWATATAYRFLQNLRRLVGIEVRDLVAQRLQARRATKGTDDLVKVGLTWDAGKGSAGDLLAALFVHPTGALTTPGAPHDPDRPQLSRDWARSALLYGPPGTGKTQLAEAVAGSLNWDFVEITPADFLDRGMDLVSARADEIFQWLMQLDRAVVLFDEIDELVRRRDGGGPETPPADMVGRFFTTTMLPRLARLWSGRRVIFFANTNSLQAVDTAVRRSQRFDATIFVMPPSRRRRAEMLGDMAGYIDFDVLSELLKDEAFPSANDPGKRRVGWYPFLRFDQLQELRLEAFDDANLFLLRLVQLGEQASADWLIPGDDAGDDLMKRLIHTYRGEADLQRVDAARWRVVQVPNGVPFPEALVAQGALTQEGMPQGFFRWVGDGSLGDVMDGAGRFRLP
jgi:ATPase family protein associated with various cellular activities (AAA)